MPIKYITKKALIYDIFKCPKGTIIPVNDIDAWLHFPEHNWVYNKIQICRTQNIKHAPFGVIPPEFPVYIKPIINLYGMGWGSHLIKNISEYENLSSSGYFWMTVLNGTHYSYDFILVNGDIKWFVCFQGYPSGKGMFDKWETIPNKEFPVFLREWISKYINQDKNYSGCLNIETIDNKIIDCHLRMGDVNQLYFNRSSDVVIKCIIDVYQNKEDACRELLNYTIPKIYLIPIFVEYNSKSELNYQDLIDVCNIDSYSQHIYSYQLDLPQEESFNPIGGIRVANITTGNLEIGLKVRNKILEIIKKRHTYRKIIIGLYCVIILVIVIYFY